MNRIDRLTAILIQMQTKRLIKASEIADRFDISLRTVYRDIRALEEAGVPIGAEAGRGYFIIDGYHLPPVMFTPEEAGAMLVAEKLVEKLADRSIGRNFFSAVQKIKSILPDTEKDFLDDINKQIAVYHRPKDPDEEYPNDFITDIQKALARSKCIELEYYSAYSKECNKRAIEPIGLTFYSYTWHMIGYCRLRKDYRDFRIDRIKNLKILDLPFDPERRFSLREYFSEAWIKGDFHEVKLSFSLEGATHVVNSKQYYGYIDERRIGDRVEINFAVNDYSYMANWILMLGDEVKIISPQELTDVVTQKVQALSKQYN